MKKQKKKNVDFLLNNKHYRRLHLIIYFTSLFIICFTYLITYVLFDKMINVLITSAVSFFIGLYIVLNRDELVKTLSNSIHERKRKKIKEDNKLGLKTTLRKITPKNKKIKFNIKTKTTLKEKVSGVKKKINGKNKKVPQKYIEIK